MFIEINKLLDFKIYFYHYRRKMCSKYKNLKIIVFAFYSIDFRIKLIMTDAKNYK